MTIGEKKERRERRAERRQERDLHEPSRERHEGEIGKVGQAPLTEEGARIVSAANIAATWYAGPRGF